jgi:exodeoxyribonuclease V alpha subunit
VFGYDDFRRLPHDVIVADEWSMADVRLAWALARAVSDGAHLLLVGDADQLPSVGPGAVLRDLLASSAVPSTRLTTIHRQAAASRIVTLAHEVKAGQAPRVRGQEGDVFAVPEHSLGVADRVAEIVATRAPSYFDLSPSDVQVLAPMYRGPAGVDRLNERLKERLNPGAGRRAVAGFHEGDRVVQTRNDAELDVANGDIGEVVAIDAAARTLQIAFPHGLVTYDGEQAADLTLAWCLTVHKSQGGEWPVVVLVLDPAHRTMLWRELVYTGITRASRALLLVGDPGLVVEAARRADSGLRQRRTLLAVRLTHAMARHTGEKRKA